MRPFSGRAPLPARVLSRRRNGTGAARGEPKLCLCFLSRAHTPRPVGDRTVPRHWESPSEWGRREPLHRKGPVCVCVRACVCVCARVCVRAYVCACGASEHSASLPIMVGPETGSTDPSSPAPGRTPVTRGQVRVRLTFRERCEVRPAVTLAKTRSA